MSHVFMTQVFSNLFWTRCHLRCAFSFPLSHRFLLCSSLVLLHPPLSSSLPLCVLSRCQAPCENLRTPSTYPGNMLPHHPAQGNFEDFTCWAEPEVEHQSACYATKANHTTRTIQRGEVRGTDTESNTGTLFFFRTDPKRRRNLLTRGQVERISQI